jgi:hypothetical protein
MFTYSHFRSPAEGTGKFVQREYQPGKPGQAVGYMEPAQVSGTAMVINGWVWEPAANQVPKTVLICRKDGLILATAASGLPRKALAEAGKNPRLASAGWRVRLEGQRDQSGLEAYAVLSDGAHVCRLAVVKP